MSYEYEHEGYDGYEGRDPYAADPYASDPYAADPSYAPDAHTSADPPSAGRGRRRRSESGSEAEFQAEFQTEFQAEPGPEPGYYDPQWEQSGLGWDQQAWNEAQRRDGYRDEYREENQREKYRDEYQDEYRDDRHDDRRGPEEYREPGEYRDTRYDSPVREAFEPARGREDFTASAASAAPSSSRAADYEPDRRTRPDPDIETEYPSERAPAPVSTASTASGVSALTGRGAFGAAGLAVVTGIGAIAATPVLAVIAGLSQIGLAIGWARTVGMPNARRTVLLVAAIGLAASALAYRLVPERAPAAMGAALGVGFVFLAADQLFRKDTGVGRHRSEALAAAVTGAAFVVLPAGYLVAQRQDSALAGACALAAAVAVLCSALVGGGKPVGILAGAVAGAAVGALTASSLASAAGAAGGAAGGFVAGIFAVAAARLADRLGTEGGDVRISSQALPMAFSAIGAVIVTQMVR